MNAPGPDGSAAWKPYAAAGLLVLLVLITYAPAYQAAFIWDDDVWLLDNTLLREPGGLEKIWFEPTAGPHYYPMVFSTFWAEYRLWGYEPIGYHAVNILLHALNAVLVWRVLKRLGVPLAWGAAALFAVHPVHVESVAWVTERKNVLSLCFALLTLLAYLRFRPLDEPERAPAWPWYAAALACFFLAAASKSVVVALPPALLVLAWWKRGRVSARDALEALPLLIVGVGFALFTMQAEAPKIAATQAFVPPLSALDRVGLAGRAAWFYAGKLLWPYPVTVVYPRWDLSVAASPALLAYPAAVLAALGLLWARRAAFGRGPLAAALIFGGALLPVLGFFNHSTMSLTYVADHYAYHASVALLALEAAVLGRLTADLSDAQRRLAGAAGAVAILGLAVLALVHAANFRTPHALWTQNLEHNPDSWPAHYNLASEYAHDGRAEDALAHYREAIRVRPNDPTNLNNMACVYLGVGKVPEAIEAFTQARAFAPADVEIRTNLGYALLRAGKLEEARAEFEGVAQDHPAYALALAGLGEALSKLDRLEESAEAFRKALRHNPELFDARYGLGMVSYRLKRYDDAVEQFATAGRLAPGNVRAIFGLGRSLEHTGKPDEAALCYREILKLDPAHQDAAKRLEALAKTPEKKEP
ncbi:MAG: tetratricopeptide repeat protein [Planctomycetota bacterium]|nr:tetratricopeptide repeat protein [Planctomycetota bacterium]